MARLDGKSTLITGGESGIGLATARRFVAEGARVFLVGLDEGLLKEAVAELGAPHGYAVADVTDEDAVARAVAAGPSATGDTTSCSATRASAARSPRSSTTPPTCSRARSPSTSSGHST